MDTRDYTGVEPTTRAFLEALEVNAGPPLSELSVDEARTAFATAETGGALGKLAASIEDRVVPGGSRHRREALRARSRSAL